MKYRVVKEFRDKNTKEMQKVGDELNLTAKRAKEILSVGPLIEKVAPVQQEEE